MARLGSEPTDPEAIIEKIREFYDLAEEALHDQVSRHESDSAIASRDEEPRSDRHRNGSNGRNGHHGSANNERRQKDVAPATNKQIQFMLTVGQRNGLSKLQLEERIAEILGQKIGVYDLSKREAGIVLDTLTQSAGTGRSR